RRRRSVQELERAQSRIVAALRRNQGGLRAEALRAELGAARRDLPRPLNALLESGAVKKSGERRATVYRLGSADAGAGRRPANGSSGSKPPNAAAAATAKKKAVASKKAGTATKRPAATKKPAATSTPAGAASTGGSRKTGRPGIERRES